MVMEKRPMTDAEEKVLERALKWWAATAADNKDAEANLDAACYGLMEERQPKLITPEERAVVEAARTYTEEHGDEPESAALWPSLRERLVQLRAAVRRLPP
jgi:hypothetical protein